MKKIWSLGCTIASMLSLCIPPAIAQNSTLSSTNRCLDQLYDTQKYLPSFRGLQPGLYLQPLVKSSYPEYLFNPSAKYSVLYLFSSIKQINNNEALFSGSELTQRMDKLLDSCPEIYTIRFAVSFTGYSITYGWVNDNKQWFKCRQPGRGQPPLQWGEQICDL